MLTDKEQLKDIISTVARQLKFRPVIVEKDYYLTIILNKIETMLSDKIIFKGGTLLNKAYLNYHRLSEDLDFTYCAQLTARSQRSRAITPIREKMPGFLKSLGLTSDKPEGEGFNNSVQYVFKVKYPSVLTAKEEMIKLEISLRQSPIDSPVRTKIKHLYQHPFTRKDFFPQGHVLSLSYNEAVAEKLKAAITRKDVAIRDFYDLWHIADQGFDFSNAIFVRLFQRKLADEDYTGDYRNNFALTGERLGILQRQVETDLLPVIRSGEVFDLDLVFKRFGPVLKRL